MITSRLVLLDNTVLSNFALVGHPELVLDLWGSDCATTAAVIAEYQAGILSRGLPADMWDELTELTLQPTEQRLANQLQAILGLGERSCLAIAVHRQGLFVTDDANARREARHLGITVTGTIGLLVLNVRQRKLTLTDANSILAHMINEGYRSPVTTLDDLI